MGLKSKMREFSVKPSDSTAIELWGTRYGDSVRVVKRSKGKFVSNVSAKQLITKA